ncbi:MAG: hypothetical protein WBM44_19190 [Waterburya sp.]
MRQETKEKSVIAKAAISSQLKLQFKILCAQQGLNMSMISEQLLQDWLLTKKPIFDRTVLSPETDMEVISVYVPESLKVRLKVLCMKEKVTMTFVLSQLIKAWVEVNKEQSFPKSKSFVCNKT